MPIPFGSQAALVAHQNSRNYPPTTQEIAIVICGGGDPMAEFEATAEMCRQLGLTYKTYAGNDQLGEFPYHIDHGATLHPEKLPMWRGQRLAHGYEWPEIIWGHRPFTNITHWTRDWQGSTGLFCTKIAREQGHTHIVLCGVPMTVEANHFVRKEPWNACHGFRRGWTAQLLELKPYVRSCSGWTAEQFGPPTLEWLDSRISDAHPLLVPKPGTKA